MKYMSVAVGVRSRERIFLSCKLPDLWIGLASCCNISNKGTYLNINYIYDVLLHNHSHHHIIFPEAIFSYG